MDDILIYSIIVYILVLVIIVIVKPKILYTDNEYKDFGFNSSSQTILPFPLCCCLLALLSYLFILLYFKVDF